MKQIPSNREYKRQSERKLERERERIFAKPTRNSRDKHCTHNANPDNNTYKIQNSGFLLCEAQKNRGAVIHRCRWLVTLVFVLNNRLRVPHDITITYSFVYIKCEKGKR